MFDDHWQIVFDQLKGSTLKLSPVASPKTVWYGVLAESEPQLLVDLASPPHLHLSHTRVVVSVQHRGGVYTFRTLSTMEPDCPYRISLSFPEHVDVVQRRVQPRVDIGGDVLCWTVDAGQVTSKLIGRASNLGVGGIAFHADAPLEVGTCLYLQFHQSSLSHLGSLQGEVVRVEPCGRESFTLAVAFRDLSPRTLAALFETVQTRILMETRYLETAAAHLE